MSNLPREPGDKCATGVCCKHNDGHLDKSCCVHDACRMMHPEFVTNALMFRGERCQKRYDHPGEHESQGGHRWTHPAPHREEEVF